MEVACSAYRVRLDAFEGPLDLLLHLVREAKLDISEISLAQVAQQYFAYLESMQQLDVELESSYLVVFAQLLELKSRLLLPSEVGDDEEERVAWEEGEEEEPSLVQKLSDYARIKEAAGWLSQREEFSLACYPRPLPMVCADEPEIELSLESLVRTMRRLERSSRAPRQAVAVAKIVLSVPERMEQLWQALLRRPLTQFSQLLGQRPHRDLVVVTFLALLELAKQRKILVYQEKTVGEIRVVKAPNND